MRTASLCTAALLVALLAPLLLIGALLDGITTAVASAAINTGAIPVLAARSLAEITTITAADCPELPPVWVIAEVEAESGWNPGAFSRDRNGGAAGLYQLNQANWRSAGGAAWTATPPPPGADVFQPAVHLRRAIPWVCANLRMATAYLADTGKPTSPLDAMLVCHIAGCGRVTKSRTGMPTPGEAGCDTACVDLVTRYIARVHALVDQYSSGAILIGDLPASVPFGGIDRGCTEADPTSGRCLTSITLHAYNEIVRVFGPPGSGRPIRSASCWDAHAWNPDSDHSRGKACDFFPTSAGQFAQGDDLHNGWRLATWLRSNAAALHIKYVIWQDRFWSPTTPDSNGWGQHYAGGGIYDVHDATGGHYDHIHTSFV